MTANYPFRVPVEEFKGRWVLVTGGTKGIGEAIVRRFTLAGVLVATTARSALPQDQNPSVFVQVDIGTAAGAQAAIDRIHPDCSASLTMADPTAKNHCFTTPTLRAACAVIPCTDRDHQE
jgi:NAD(P)-dependent dehydrogenase (short-subunit alcohol dehydrogenase family)